MHSPGFLEGACVIIWLPWSAAQESVIASVSRETEQTNPVYGYIPYMTQGE